MPGDFAQLAGLRELGDVLGQLRKGAGALPRPPPDCACGLWLALVRFMHPSLLPAGFPGLRLAA
jgi:hypothetical protein